MKFREAIEKIEGLRFIAGKMDLLSGPGRTALLETEFTSDIPILEREFDNLEKATAFVADPLNTQTLAAISCMLMQAKDIKGTCGRLAAGKVLEDTELFEIKSLGIVTKQLRPLIADSALSETGINQLPDLSEVVKILDPENTGNAYFHIYDAYSPELRELRAQLRKLQAETDIHNGECDAVMGKCLDMEALIREKLSDRLAPFADTLKEALQTIARIDILIAKARLVPLLRLCRPYFNKTFIQYRKLRYLPAEEMLERKKKAFQPVDINIIRGVTLITGTNMGGKTLTLKSVALAQALAQFGFYVPASEAAVVPVEYIEVMTGDSQSVAGGLSSFGAEILLLDRIILRAMKGDKMMVLVDEPARTTNPEEGKAIVEALVEILQSADSFSLITSHYGNIKGNCRRLKVKGLKETDDAGHLLTPGSLQHYMDYSLISDEDGEMTREAIRIGRLLGISNEFASKIEEKYQIR